MGIVMGAILRASCYRTPLSHSFSFHASKAHGLRAHSGSQNDWSELCIHKTWPGLVDVCFMGVQRSSFLARAKLHSVWMSRGFKYRVSQHHRYSALSTLYDMTRGLNLSKPETVAGCRWRFATRPHASETFSMKEALQQ